MNLAKVNPLGELEPEMAERNHRAMVENKNRLEYMLSGMKFAMEFLLVGMYQNCPSKLSAPEFRKYYKETFNDMVARINDYITKVHEKPDEAQNEIDLLIYHNEQIRRKVGLK